MKMSTPPPTRSKRPSDTLSRRSTDVMASRTWADAAMATPPPSTAMMAAVAMARRHPNIRRARMSSPTISISALDRENVTTRPAASTVATTAQATRTRLLPRHSQATATVMSRASTR